MRSFGRGPLDLRPVTVLFALYPGLISIVSLAQ